MPSEEELLLLFKESGVEFVETAAKAVGTLGDAMETVNTAQQAAIDALKEEGKVVEDLEEKISKLKRELEALADAHKAGLITQDKYKEQSDALGKVISENETVLKRLTASQREADKAAAETAQAAQEEAAALSKITAALNQLEAEEQQELLAAEQLAEKHYQMMTAADAAAGTGSGEGGKGGFAGLTANVMKGEKVLAGLAGGAGYGRMGGMLESITAALGLAGGTGMAAGGLIFAFEALIPKIETFIEKITGAGEAAKRAAEQIKEADEQMAKFRDMGTEEQEAGAKAVKPLLAHGHGTQIAQGIEQVLRQQGFGLDEFTPGVLDMPEVSAEAKEAIRKRQEELIKIHRGKIITELEAGRGPAISEVSGMASQFPGFFPVGTEQHLRQALPENIEAAKKQAKKAEADSSWADTTYAKQAAAAKESTEIDIELDKARKDKTKKEEAWDKFDRHLMDSEADRVFRENTKAAKDAKAAQTKAEHDAKAAQTKAEHDARMSTPEAQTARELKAQGQAIMAAEREQNQYRADMGASPFEASELEQIKHKAMQHMPEARRRGISIGQLVSMMMAEQANEIEQGMMQGLGQQDRSRQNVNPRGGH